MAEEEAYAAPPPAAQYQSEAFVASNRVSQHDAPLPKAKVSKPERLPLLRSFFPENWLFSLEMVEGDQHWERCGFKELAQAIFFFCVAVISIGGGEACM